MNTYSMEKDAHHAVEVTPVQGCLDGLDKKESLLPGFGWQSGPLHERSGPDRWVPHLEAMQSEKLMQG